MKRIFQASILAAVSTIGFASGAMESPMENQSISTSKQFVVYAADPTLRSEIARRAEDHKRAILEILGLKDGWKMPVILNLGPDVPNMRRPPKFRTGIYEGDGNTLRIQMDVFDLDFLKQPDFDTELVSAILLEFAHRDHPVRAGRPFNAPPVWAVDGLLEKIRTRRGGGQAALYAGLLATSETPRIEEFFKTRAENLDPTSRAVFRAQAAALVDTLLDQPDGRAGLAAYLFAPRRSPANIDEVLGMFPSLEGDRARLGRHWLLAIARASAANRIDPLSVRDTGRELDKILDVRALPDPRNPEVAAMSGPFALEAIARSRNGRFIIAQKNEELLRLTMRAHPVYRPLVDEYYRIVSELAGRPKARVQKRIAAAEEMRASLAGQTSEMQSHMDWVEATKIVEEDPGLSAAVESSEEAVEKDPRPDAISRHLDALAERGW